MSEIDSERTITMKHHRWFNTYIGFMFNLSIKFEKEFNNISVATARSIMKSCPTKL